MVGLSMDDDSAREHDGDHGDHGDHGSSGNQMMSPSSYTSSSFASLVATRAAEAELEAAIARLQSELLSAQQALDRLRESSSSNNNNDSGTTSAVRQAEEDYDPQPAGSTTAGGRSSSSSRVIITRSSLSPASGSVVTRPPGKRGYLFRWMDRSIGWSGTKWTLRFVALEGGRISYYGTHTDTSPRYVLTLTGCAVRDEGWKRNRRHSSWKSRRWSLVGGVSNSSSSGDNESALSAPPLDEPGAYFFVFSIYQRKEGSFRSDDSGSDDIGISPLLRFSTPSRAEKDQWIQRIAETCAWCETEDFAIDENNRASELARQQQQQALMSQAMPEAKDGTLPPLIFAPPPLKPPARRPSFHRRTPSQARLYASHTHNADADKMETQKKGYPPSKPMHRSAAPSLLSSDAPPQNYRGLFNLSLIILFVSSFRLLLGTIQQHGFVLTRVVRHLRDVREIRRDPWQEAPLIAGFLLQLLFVMLGFTIEWLMSRRRLHPAVGDMLHQINAHTALFVTICIVWQWIHNPVVGAVLLLHATITWMKLLSYAHANEDYRLGVTSKAGLEAIRASLALVENLDPSEADLVYPQNITAGNMFYFWFAPTLTYQIAFPKYPRVRLWVVTSLAFRMLVAVSAFTFLTAQVVTPALENVVMDLEATHGTITAPILAEYWLKLAVANTYLWLLMFYIYFHLYLNLFAEILRFGDRVFYRDWWNSSEVSAYWRLWNTPVHYWLIRHVYFPCLRRKVSRPAATFIVFLLSAVMHEVLVSVPFHMIRPWSFLGMLGQIPLVGLTKQLERKYPGSSLGNVIFWISFCVVGQPMAILFYTIDYQFQQKHHHGSLSGTEPFSEPGDECRIMWRDRCLIR